MSPNSDEIRDREFSTTPDGFAPAEVRAYLNHVADEIERLKTGAGAAEAPTGASPLAHQVGDRVNEIIDAAQQSADAMVQDAETWSMAHKGAAQRDADALRAEAEHVKRLADEAALGTRSEADGYAARTRSEADGYSTQVRSEADSYGSLTRTDADEHAARVEAESAAAAKQHHDSVVSEANTLLAEAQIVLADTEAVRHALVSRVEELSGDLGKAKHHLTDPLPAVVVPAPTPVDPVPPPPAPTEALHADDVAATADEPVDATPAVTEAASVGDSIPEAPAPEPQVEAIPDVADVAESIPDAAAENVPFAPGIEVSSRGENGMNGVSAPAEELVQSLDMPADVESADQAPSGTGWGVAEAGDDVDTAAAGWGEPIEDAPTWGDPTDAAAAWGDEPAAEAAEPAAWVDEPAAEAAEPAAWGDEPAAAVPTWGEPAAEAGGTTGWDEPATAAAWGEPEPAAADPTGWGEPQEAASSWGTTDSEAPTWADPDADIESGWGTTPGEDDSLRWLPPPPSAEDVEALEGDPLAAMVRDAVDQVVTEGGGS